MYLDTFGFALSTMPADLAALYRLALCGLDSTAPRADGKSRGISFAIAFEGRCGGEEVFDAYLGALDAMDAVDALN